MGVKVSHNLAVNDVLHSLTDYGSKGDGSVVLRLMLITLFEDRGYIS